MTANQKSETRNQKLDVLIFGGGVAGLWLLDELHRAGFAALLLERYALGRGQTVASQGIIHGGLKYTLKGRLTGSAKAIADAPAIWRDCLEGRSAPDLTHTAVRSPCCYLWRTATLKSLAGAIGARAGLRVAPQKIADEDRPAVLRDCPGDVLRLDEQVIDPVSLIADLAAQHHPRLARYERVTFDGDAVVIDDRLTLDPRDVVFAAGEGNAALRQRCGLSPDSVQTRPLHMVMVRGEALPELNGHCADGMATRVTITTATDAAGRRVWQLGGQLAERGVTMEPEPLIALARQELRAVLPGFDPAGLRWATYRVNRAEARTPGLLRPEEATATRDGRFITAFPTKLAMAPHLAKKVTAMLPPPAAPGGAAVAWPDDTPRPAVAPPPWETSATWIDAP